MTTRHRSFRMVLHRAPLPDRPEGNAAVLYECASRREALRLLTEEARGLRAQDNWDVTGLARGGHTVIVTDRTDLWFGLYITAQPKQTTA